MEQASDIQWPKILIGLGLVLILVGIAGRLLQGKLNWIGRLPGDIRIEREGFHFYAPIMTMLLLSLAVNALIWLLRRFF